MLIIKTDKFKSDDFENEISSFVQNKKDNYIVKGIEEVSTFEHQNIEDISNESQLLESLIKIKKN